MHKPPPPPPAKTIHESLIPPDQRETLLQIMKGVEDRLSGVIEAAGKQTQERLDDHEGRLLRVERAQVEYKGLAVEIRSLGNDVHSLLEYAAAFGSRDVGYEKRLSRIELTSIRVAAVSGTLAGLLVSSFVAAALLWGFRHGLLK